MSCPRTCATAGPRVSTERVKLEFKGGHYGFTRDAGDEGVWCDLWLFDDLVVPTGLLHAPAGIPRSEQRNVPAALRGLPRRDLRPDRASRRHDARTTSQAAVNFPNIFPRFAGQGFLERADKDLALDVPAHLQRLDDRRVVGRRRPRPADPAHARAALGPRPGSRGGTALRGEGQLRDRVQREPGQARPPVAVLGGVGRALGGVRGDRHDGVDAHRVVVEHADHVGRRPARHVDVALRAERAGVAVRLGVLRHPAAVPRHQDRVRREPGGLDAVPARAHGQRVARRRGWRRVPGRRRATR